MSVLTAPSPATHRCTIGTIDYSLADHGFLVCALSSGGCGREWRWVPQENGGHTWAASPRPLDGAQRYAERQRAAQPQRRRAGPW